MSHDLRRPRPHLLTERPPATNAMLLDMVRRFQLDEYSPHGSEHWLRVLANGRILAPLTGADPVVVDLFALLHDVCRENEDHDPGHGPRAAALAAELRGLWFDLDDSQMALLTDSCTRHDRGETEADPTVQTCWDADRLDLGRVGIVPDPRRLCTNAARDVDLITQSLQRSRRPGAIRMATWPGCELPLFRSVSAPPEGVDTSFPTIQYDWAHQVSFRDDPEAQRLALQGFGHAAGAGLGRAQWRWGGMRAEGQGREADLTAAVGAYQDAASHGVVEALNSLGLHLVKGWGAPVDEARGLALIREAAEAGYEAAAYNLGQFYSEGRHLPKDREMAIAEYRKAGLLPEALFNVATLLLEGTPSPQDKAEAIAALTNAARLGLAAAQYSLAVLYYNGQVIEQDDRRFVFWIERSAQQGHELAEQVIAKVNRANGQSDGSASPAD